MKPNAEDIIANAIYNHKRGIDLIKKGDYQKGKALIMDAKAAFHELLCSFSKEQQRSALYHDCLKTYETTFACEFTSEPITYNAKASEMNNDFKAKAYDEMNDKEKAEYASFQADLCAFAMARHDPETQKEIIVDTLVKQLTDLTREEIEAIADSKLEQKKDKPFWHNDSKRDPETRRPEPQYRSAAEDETDEPQNMKQWVDNAIKQHNKKTD